MKLLILGHTIPEPSTTAAGSRMLQLISIFQEEGYKIHFATSALMNPRSIDLSSIDFTLDVIRLNDPSFDTYIKDLNPDVVMYDRFVIEEHYGWRVAEHCPNALRILDTEDLHFLRKAREAAFKKEGHLSNVNLYTDQAKRELASIMRCDLSLIISSYEMKLLTDTFNVSKSQLFYIPFLVDDIPEVSDLNPFDSRSDFMSIGNLFHAPNVDSVLYLKKNIWPEIRRQLPSATLSVYGNYAPQQINELHNVKEGFLIKGWAPSVKEVMSSSRVCLAPLRFGAGLKGKLLDAMIYGTPAVTTSIGAEGMYGTEESIFCKEEVSDFVAYAVHLHSEETTWSRSQSMGNKILKERYSRNQFASKFKTVLKSLHLSLDQHRKQNFVSQILQHQTMQATKFMSKWIEEKNK